AYWPSIGLGITQTMGYGTLFYAYAILLPEMADDLSLSLSGIFGVLSLALFFGGAAAPLAGALTDRFGGRMVMTGGSVVAGLALLLLPMVSDRSGLFFAILLAEAAAMFVLYPVAFASIARLDLPVPTQRSITVITLFGGVASTIFWPLTLWLYNTVGWETTWMVLGIAYLVVAVPIHFFALSGPERDQTTKNEKDTEDWPELQGRDRKTGLLWMIVSFMFSGYLIGAVMTLWVTNVQDLGHSAAMAAAAGAVIGPFKTIGRFLDLLVTRNLHPMNTYLFSLALILSGFLTILALGFTWPGLMLAAALYGMGDGIKTIARGTMPLALFGHKGYGARLGWIAFGSMALNASSPFFFAWLTESYGGWWSFAVMASIVSVAIATFFFIPYPRRQTHDPQDRRMPQSR
ncbi:MAG: MFS transporter, partial [Pseudomonadota bacterium]